MLKEFGRETRSELETAPYQPAEMSGSIFLGQKRMGDIQTLILWGTFNNLLTGCRLLMLGGGWVQDHSLSSHRDITCEWEAYLWCVSPGNNLRYNKWHYLLKALLYAISSFFGEKDLTKSAVYSSCLACLSCWTTALHSKYFLTCWAGIVDCWKRKQKNKSEQIVLPQITNHNQSLKIKQTRQERSQMHKSPSSISVKQCLVYALVMEQDADSVPSSNRP